ncbi:oxidoreductase [Rhizobium lentis]|uniref:SDR family oxidoreductase n=1 Tax=Rhizobium lentis TaxID=1138194 RepID=A0ABS7IRF4_9HYPH|nr:oxidoreductase [Rhizobium lentis]MBX5093890.1 SDR family oxidoreductase [Rhizobium lentis]MBX5101184.1 SDR family oxidoreductase [Rhizobium lentis]
MPKPWNAGDIPPQHGRTFVVTGTGGLGLESALALAKAGGDVIIAGRDRAKGKDAVNRIKTITQNARVSFEVVDLANLTSVKAMASRLEEICPSIDVLINNAGVMTPPTRRTTDDGFELQFGTNYLAHFALTAHLLPLLQRAPRPRVVTLSSIAVKSAGVVIDFENLQAERSYKPMPAYAQSKLACLMFALELQRRSDAADWGIRSIAAHPGVSRTNLLHNAPGRYSMHGIMRSLLWFLFQPAAQGALPTLFAATSPDANNGSYYGPGRLWETRGYPTVAPIPMQALDLHIADQLWRISEELTGLRFGENQALPQTSGFDDFEASMEG